MEELQEVERLFKWRVDNMYFPELPGINALHIAEDLAEYLALRAVEDWARDRRESRSG